jgi:Zn-dependent protease with chaperone function
VSAAAADGAHDIANGSPDPFALPPETDARFALLGAALLTVVLASLVAFGTLYEPWRADMQAMLRCPGIPSRSTIRNDELTVQALEAANRCIAAGQRAEAGGMLAGVLLLMACAGLIHLLGPVWRMRLWRVSVALPGRGASARPGIRVQGLQRLDAARLPRVAAALADCCRLAGLPRPPVFVVAGLDPSVDAAAFGRLGQAYVALTAGLLVQATRNPQAFRALVLHELGHVANGDIWKSGLLTAMWQAFLFIGLPVVVKTGGLSALIFLVRTVTGPLVLVALSLRAILRARELYADARVVSWAGQAPIGAALAGLSGRPTPWWRRVLGFHPSAAERIYELHQPTRLFRTGAWDVFATGLAAALVMAELPVQVGLLLRLTPWGTVSTESLYRVTGFVVAACVVGTVGAAAWRSTLAARAAGSGLRTDRLAVAFFGGCTIGEIAVALSLPGMEAPDALSDPVFGLVAHAALLVGTFAFFRWLRGSAEHALSGGAPGARVGYAANLLVGAGTFGVFLAWWVPFASLGLGLISQKDHSVADVVISWLDGSALLVLVGLGAFPLAAAVLPRASGPGTPASVLRPLRVGLRTDLAWGAAVAVAFAATIEVAWWLVGAAQAPDGRRTVQLLRTVLHWQEAAAIAALGVLGSIIGVRARDLPILRTFLAASLTGLLLAVVVGLWWDLVWALFPWPAGDCVNRCLGPVLLHTDVVPRAAQVILGGGIVAAEAAAFLVPRLLGLPGERRPPPVDAGTPQGSRPMAR